MSSAQNSATINAADPSSPDHDFDRRRDGPQQIDKDPENHHEQNPEKRRKSVQFNADGIEESNTTEAQGRKSWHGTRGRDEEFPFGRKSHTGGRKSMDMNRRERDFDSRRDGPYGRPSITMTRRRSGAYDAFESGTETRPTRANTDDVLSGDEDGRDENGQPPSMDTLQSSDAAFEPEPPPLNYDIWSRRKAILLFWFLIIVDCVISPIALYFGLWYGTHLSHNAVFSIVTAALGGVSIFEYLIRFWRLWKKDSTCRVIGARRSYLDWFHWNFSLGWIVVILELIIGTVPEDPPIRLLAMPCASMMYAFALELLVVDLLRYFEVPAPVRISSIPKGSQLRPGIYSVIEDIIAVDGSGGTAYREALNKRYEASHVFRAMLRRLGAFWAFGSMAMAIVLTVLIFTINKEAAYVIGWTVPFVWGGIWALITWFYVKRKLKEEKVAWSAEVAAKSRA